MQMKTYDKFQLLVKKILLFCGCRFDHPLCGMMHIKEPESERVAYVAAEGLLTRYLSGPLRYYVWRHISFSKMCWVRC